MIFIAWLKPAKYVTFKDINVSTIMKRILIIVLVSVLVIGLGAGSFAVFGTYSNGTRVGTLVKFSKKGYVFKTYEGQLTVGGFTPSDDGELSNIWEFSVKRGEDEVRQQIEQAMEEGEKVRLYYKEMFYQFDWRGDTKYFVYQVEDIEE
jgi:flagellar basal body-associated protein FliL